MRTKEQYLARFIRLSAILNRETPDRGKPPSSSFMIFGLQGLKDFREDILEKGQDDSGIFNGSLEHARYKAKEARANWKRYLKQNPLMDQNAKPVDHYADRINFWDAKVAVLEKEAWELNRIIEEAEEKEREAQKKKATKRKKLGDISAKMIDGKLARVGGRPVKLRADGKYVFKDDGTSVEEYIQFQKRQRIEAEKKKRIQILSDESDRLLEQLGRKKRVAIKI